MLFAVIVKSIIDWNNADNFFNTGFFILKIGFSLVALAL